MANEPSPGVAGEHFGVALMVLSWPVMYFSAEAAAFLMVLGVIFIAAGASTRAAGRG